MPDYPMLPDDVAAAPQPANPYEAPEASEPSEASEPENPYEGATPPGYDEWPTHGGYLGCLMGVVLGLVLAPLGYILFGLIGSALFPHLGYGGVWLAGALTLIVYLVCFVALARLGWRLGKRFYREYPRPAASGATSVSLAEATRAEDDGASISGTSAAQGQ